MTPVFGAISCYIYATVWHRKQGPFCGAHKTYKKPSTFDKYVTKFLGTANPIPNFGFADKYVKNNKQIKYFKFFSGHIGSHII